MEPAGLLVVSAGPCILNIHTANGVVAPAVSSLSSDKRQVKKSGATSLSTVSPMFPDAHHPPIRPRPLAFAPMHLLFSSSLHCQHRHDC